MQQMRARGGIGWASSVAGPLRAQGATEYLVLLAVVLIIALVSIALLGFFPGISQDAQVTESQLYWKSASPISIVEAGANVYSVSAANEPYIRIKNTGAYPIRMTALIGGDGGKAPQFWNSGNPGCTPAASGAFNFSDYTYLAPGEETYYGWSGTAPGIACDRYYNYVSGGSGGNQLGGATSLCQNSSTSPGTLVIPNFGFEYIVYIEGQQLTKREVGKTFVVKCGRPA